MVQPIAPWTNMKRARSEAERQERKRAAVARSKRIWLLRVAVPNLAQGFTVNGAPRVRPYPLKPEVQRLVDEYKAQQARAAETEPDVPMSALEQQWRELRASMGEISVPAPEIGLRGVYET